MNKRHILKLFNVWPPFLGAGIKIRRISADIREIDVEMKLNFLNRNYVGTHFGGSLYAMVDPFYMLILLENLGKEYIVWDKAATIRFKKPGKGTVKASFRISEEELREIRHQADTMPKTEPTFTVNILNEDNEIVAEVEKTLYVKKKSKEMSD